MWKPIRRCAFGSRRPTALLVAVLTACSGGVQDERSAETPEQDERRQVRSFWQLNREANRFRLASDFETAVERFEAALEIDPVHEDSLYYLGISLEELGEYVRAEDVYRRILELNPASNRAVTQLADLKATVAPGSKPDFAEARTLIQRSIQINREHSGPYLRLGRLALAEKDSAEAIRHFETAAGFGSAEGDLMVGFTLLLQGDSSAAAERFQAVLAAAERERARTQRGEKAEGDVRPTSGGRSKSPVQAASARAQALLDTIREPTPDGPWRDATRQTGLPSDGGRAAWADYDGDGWTDVLIAGPGVARLYRNDRGVFRQTPSEALHAIHNVWDAAWGDYDRDGDVDLYLIRPGYRGVGSNQLLRNEGEGAFLNITAGSGLDSERSTFAAEFSDLDGDGRPELIESGAQGVRIYRNQSGSWTEASLELGISVGHAVTDFELADFNADDRTDLFLLVWRKNVILYLSDEDGRLIDRTHEAGLGGLRGLGYSALALDYDRDGRQDLAWTGSVGSGSNALRLYRNVGETAFQEAHWPSQPTPRGATSLSAGDFDGDRQPDLLLANGSLMADRLTPSQILLSSGGPIDLPHSGSALGGDAIDIDRDGRLEIYLAGNPGLLGAQHGRSLLLRRR